MNALRDGVRVGINPIAWTNDDFHELGDDIPLERCLAEAHDAGYAGIELGRKLPRDPAALRLVLDAAGLALVSGWHCLYLRDNAVHEERRRFRAHLALLRALACRVAIVAECSGRTYTDRAAPLRFGAGAPRLDDASMSALARGLDELSALAADAGMALAYHPHAGTVIQDAEDVDRLFARTRRAGLLFDSGHLALAGSDPPDTLRRWGDRVTHVHLKNVRPAVARRARAEGHSFERAVKAGVFTVPGDAEGGVDFDAVFAELARLGYAGWLVVEAEQDPAVAEPAAYARRGREHVRAAAGV